MSTPSPSATLRARWLVPARVAWVVMAITVLAIILFSIPSSFEHYSSVCTAASEVCSSERVVHQATPEGVRALGETGLSLRSYALLNVVVDKVFQLVWFAVGALIFWRRSDDRMKLLVSVFLVSFGPVAVDPTSAYTLISSQPAWWFPVRSVDVVGSVSPCCSSSSFPADGSCRIGRAGSQSRLSSMMFPTFSFCSCTPVCPRWRLFRTWCSWGA